MTYEIEDEEGNIFSYTRSDIQYLSKGDTIKKGYNTYYTVENKFVDLDEYKTTVYVVRDK